MSTLVFPTPAGLAFGWPVKKTPSFSTIVQSTVSGRGEVRIGLQVYPRWQFEMDLTYLQGDYSVQSSALATLMGFFMSVQGGLNNWLFLDPYDNYVAEMSFGTGDGTTTAFQLTRSFPGGGVDIIQNLNGAPEVFVNGMPTSVTISATGVVTFATAPPAAAALTWTGNFYFLCRFDEDAQSSLQEDFYRIWSLSGLKFTSVIL